jgi:transposase
LTITRTAFERVYRAQKDVRVKERMLLVRNVVYYGKIAAHVTREIHKSKGWACQWLKRYKKRTRRIDGHRPKGGRDIHRGIQTSRIPDKNYFEGE